MYDSLIYLIAESDDGRDEYGNRIITTEEVERFADIRSIGSGEFYQSARAGLKTSLKDVLSDDRDYNGEVYFKYNDDTYIVTRTYINKNHELELTGSKLRGV